MKPIDFKLAAWDDVQSRLDGMREAVYRALASYGPCTTRQLEARCGISLFTIRPRVTELCQLGLAEAVGGTSEGIYAAIPITTARQTFENRKKRVAHEQLLMPI